MEQIQNLKGRYKNEYWRIENLAKKKIASYKDLKKPQKKPPHDQAFKCIKCKEETGKWQAYQVIYEFSGRQRYIREEILNDFPLIGLQVSYCQKHLPS